MNPKVQITTEYLNGLKPLTFMDDLKIKERFVQTYAMTHAGRPEEEAEDFYNIESMHFKRIVNASADLQKCTMFSLYACFIDIVISGLTFDPEAGFVYVLFDNFNIATRDNPMWEKRAKNEISPYGELALRVQQGQILYADDPVIVYSSDFWEPGYREDGTRYSIYRAKLPRPAEATIIGSFIKLTRPDKSFDIPWFSSENINEWKAASSTKNKGKGANSLYGAEVGQINIGFLKAKTIKHAFKALPKLKLVMSNTSLESSGMEVAANGQLVETAPLATAANQQAAPPPAAFTPPPPPAPFSASPVQQSKQAPPAFSFKPAAAAQSQGFTIPDDGDNPF